MYDSNTIKKSSDRMYVCFVELTELTLKTHTRFPSLLPDFPGKTGEISLITRKKLETRTVLQVLM